MNDTNPFAFILEKPRERLDREFYARAQKFADVDDDMWRYLLNLIPDRGGSYASREKRMVRMLSRPLRIYYFVRKFDGEWGSEGMEGIFTNDDWEAWVPEAIEAFRYLGASRHADLIDRIIPIANQARSCRLESDLDTFASRLRSFDRKWEKLAAGEDFFGVIFEDIQRDPTAYVHPSTP